MGFFQARILEWVAISFSRGPSWARDWTQVSWFLTEPSGKPKHWILFQSNKGCHWNNIEENPKAKLMKEKAMAPHSSTLAWRVPWTEEPGRLPSMGSLRVGHDWATSLSLFTFMHWRRKWQPTPVFLPGESLGWGSLVGCRLWGCTESDTTEAT